MTGPPCPDERQREREEKFDQFIHNTIHPHVGTTYLPPYLLTIGTYMSDMQYMLTLIHPSH